MPEFPFAFFFPFVNTLFNSATLKICCAFCSAEFKGFLDRSLIQVAIIASQSPQANGHIERMVQMTKGALQQTALGV